MKLAQLKDSLALNIKNMKFNVGQNVVIKEGIAAYLSFNIMRVMYVLNDHYLLLEYFGFGTSKEINLEHSSLDEPLFNREVYRYKEEELFTIEEAQKEILRLEEIESKIEAEFTEVRNQIKSKLEQAADLVEEALKLAKPFDKNLYDLQDEVRLLNLALNNNGWKSSNTGC